MSDDLIHDEIRRENAEHAAMKEKMVERVAKAICWSERQNRWPKCPCDGTCDHRNSGVSEPKARAAIEAMREPTQAMIDAEPEGFKEFWQDVIDEALR